MVMNYVRVLLPGALLLDPLVVLFVAIGALHVHVCEASAPLLFYDPHPITNGLVFIVQFVILVDAVLDDVLYRCHWQDVPRSTLCRGRILLLGELVWWLEPRTLFVSDHRMLLCYTFVALRENTDVRLMEIY